MGPEFVDAGAQEDCTLGGKAGLLELGERAFQRPAEVARTQAPDFRTHFLLAHRGAQEAGEQVHLAPGENLNVGAGAVFACLGLRASLLDFF